MRGTIAALLIAGALAVVLMVAGCSGAGVAAGDVRGDAVRTTAEDHLSAVTLLKGWLKILHVREEIPEAGVDACASCEPTLDMEFFEDGSFRMWGTNSDCSTFDLTYAADESGFGTFAWPDGRSVDMVWGAPEYEGDKTIQQMQETFGDGTRLTYLYTIDFGPLDAPQTMEGTAELPDGQQMDFSLRRTQEGEDHLRLWPPDGASLDVHIPVQSTGGALFWPRFEEGGTGVYLSAAGDRLDFTLQGADDRWDSWSFNATDGTQGDFALDETFAGVGQLTHDGSVLGALRWPETCLGVLDLVTSGASDVAPSAAARAFQMDQWVANIAVMGPMPVY